MNEKPSIKAFRTAKADEAFEMAGTAIEKSYYNSAASSLYYSCFYLISALMVEHDLSATTHAGLKRLFGLKFVKEGLIDKKWSKLLTTLFDRRHESDYEDFFIISEEEVKELYKEVIAFRTVLKSILEVS